MKKQIFAVLSLVCGLLGFNFIAIAQTMSYMQIRQYIVEQPDLDLELFAINATFKICTLVLGVLALAFSFLYKKSKDQHARLFNGLGGLLGIICIILSIFPIYMWML